MPWGRAHGRFYKHICLTMLNKFTSLPDNPLLLRRTACLAVIIACIVATFTLISATDRATSRTRDAAIQSSWHTNAALSASPISPELIYSRFNMKSTAATADLTWQANSTIELRASLRALDAAQINLAQLKITRSGTNFLVNAERAP